MECSEPVEKKSGQSNNFEWVTALLNMYINGKNEFFWPFNNHFAVHELEWFQLIHNSLDLFLKIIVLKVGKNTRIILLRVQGTEYCVLWVFFRI